MLITNKQIEEKKRQYKYLLLVKKEFQQKAITP